MIRSANQRKAVSISWEAVEEALETAIAVTWDECHKIYVLMDWAQVELMENYGYEPIVPVSNKAETLELLGTWFAESCGLRFITAVETTPDLNDGFTDLISQGEFDRFE